MTNDERRRRFRSALAVIGAILALALCAVTLHRMFGAPSKSRILLPTLAGHENLVNITPDEIWADSTGMDSDNFTPRAMLGEDIDAIGVLTIEKIDVSIHVYDSEDTMEDMKKGASHYRSSSYWNGNVAVAAHIGNASYSWFERLKELTEGDVVEYETALGTRQYRVKEIRTIEDDDWSVIDRTEENCLTMTTCIDGQESKRLCVRAVEVV